MLECVERRVLGGILHGDRKSPLGRVVVDREERAACPLDLDRLFEQRHIRFLPEVDVELPWMALDAFELAAEYAVASPLVAQPDEVQAALGERKLFPLHVTHAEACAPG